jgi:hypothetical protein
LGLSEIEENKGKNEFKNQVKGRQRMKRNE